MFQSAKMVGKTVIYIQAKWTIYGPLQHINMAKQCYQAYKNLKDKHNE
jgi:hypothetical protein